MVVAKIRLDQVATKDLIQSLLSHEKKPTEICGLCQTLFFFHGTTSLARQKFAALIYIQGFFVEYRLDLGAGP